MDSASGDFDKIGDEDIAKALRQLAQQQSDHHRDTSDKLGAIQAAQTRLSTAFVNGDVDGHRMYHQAIIDRALLVNQILRETLIHIAKYGAFAGLAWLLWTLGHAMKLELFK